MVDLSVPMGRETQPRGLGLAALARRQHGVASVRQLETLFGYTEGSLRKAVAAGRLHPLYRGVYAVGHSRLTLHGQSLAAVLSCGPGSLLSHWSAAWLWGLGGWSPAPFHVLASGPRRQTPPVRRHRARNLVDADCAIEEGIPVTAVPRTLLDMAAVTGDGQFRKIVERAEKLGKLDAPEARAAAERSRGHRGYRRLRRSLLIHRPPVFARSEFEIAVLNRLLAEGLPRPSVNYYEGSHELDLYWADRRFAVELDSWGTHGTHSAWERDHLRDEELALAGIQVVRVSEERFLEAPRDVTHNVATLLSRRPLVCG